MPDWLVIILLCSFKFVMALPLAILHYKMSFFESVLYSAIGGGIGVVVFAYTGEQIFRFIDKLRKKHKGIAHHEWRKKTKITKKHRRIVAIKKSYGFIGVVFLTPVLLSIPIGVVVALRIYKKFWFTVKWMTLSVFIWANILSLVVYIGYKFWD